MAYYKLVNGKRYGPYNYQRRTHYWTVKDLARVARHLKEKDKIDAGEILVYVAMAVGMGTIFCKAAKAITSGLSIMSFIEKLGTTLAFSQFVKVLLEYLLQIKLVAPMWLKIIVALLIATLIFIEKLLQALNEMIQDRAVVKAVSDEINKLCDTAKRLSGQAVDATCDANKTTSDACYWADKTAQELANKLQNDIVEATGTSLIEQAIQIINDRLHDDSTASWVN